jgi:hypothetical protein
MGRKSKQRMATTLKFKKMVKLNEVKSLITYQKNKIDNGYRKLICMAKSIIVIISTVFDCMSIS